MDLVLDIQNFYQYCLMLIVSAQQQIGSGNIASAAYGSMAVNIKRKPCGF
jgi:phosphomevalonate kinase